ncbi:MBL fold metallo-hydrolase [Solimonas sp. K1W22B-7]|uniref:MBL fold metallo-hydrolase n=1 Tax=Solimonas sp. K1W22B-7 TaxID=2303331 RepID=UPI000E337552|nr:MBL fold metallo-hydrolase [Solimonas sp. K1W22B-7]AXQ28583.1 MBL fold metallo-hydrolase [Solimonas sp. K1W22B-7]
MSATTGDGKPALASLVTAGAGQVEAEAITDFIYRVKDISNAYLVRTGDGDLLINAGFMDNAERNRTLFAKVASGPLRRIILTQAHPDHYGGVPLLREAQTQVIAGAGFVETWRYFHDLGPYLARRSRKLWASTLPRKGNPPPPPEVVPDITVEGRHAFELGGRRFELIATPGGETLDSISVWMPDERIVFTGNLFGPVFLSMPNLTTVRGDKPRLVQRYLRSLEAVRDLGAELLITGHGEPVRGAATIRAGLDRMHAAVSFVRDATIAGMNDGKDVHTLMREIRLPEELRIGEYHGKLAWAVRSIWEEHSGWFHYDSSTSLYGVPRSSIDADLAQLAGGAGALAARARQKLDEGRPLEALHLLDVALGAEPAQADALAVKKAALQRLLKESGGTNLSETMWLRSEIAAVDALLAGPQ